SAGCRFESYAGHLGRARLRRARRLPGLVPEEQGRALLPLVSALPAVVPRLAAGGHARRRLRPFHVQECVGSKPAWKTGKRGAIIAVQRAFNWAARSGRIPASPLRGMEKPAQGRREKLITPGEYEEALALVKDQRFRDLLELSWETGARPNELFTVEA